MKTYLLLLSAVLILMGARCVSTEQARQIELENKQKCSEAATKKFEEINEKYETGSSYLDRYEFSKSRNSCFMLYHRDYDVPAGYSLTSKVIIDVYTGRTVGSVTVGDYEYDKKNDSLITEFGETYLEIFGE